MLTKLRIKNFKSFKEEITIDFTKTNYKILSKTNIYENTLKGSMFIGANASGKTNIILVIRKLLELLFADQAFNLAQDGCLFSEEGTMILEYSFRISQSDIIYYIEYNPYSESLVEKLKVDNELVMNRINNVGESEITDNKIFDNLDNESLLLREIYFNTKFRGHNALKQWFDFLINSIYIDAYYGGIFYKGKEALMIDKYLEDQGVEEINAFFHALNFEQLIEYSRESQGSKIKFESGDDEKNIFFKRKGIGEPIPYYLESLGNRNLLHLLPSFFHVVKKGGMLIIDEFSSGFHNKLEELLIRYFMLHAKESQLFFVSHSTNLISNSLLRPDQIYVTEFVEEKGSVVKRVSDEKPREAQNTERMYLGGVFGGVPRYRNDISFE